MTIANIRVLRMAAATSLCLLVSQIFAWPMSYIAPVVTMFVLALPLPALPLAGGVRFVVVFLAAIWGSLIFLPVIVHYRLAGLLLVALALYWSFYYTARGGSPVLGALTTVGIALVTSIGSVSIDAVLGVMQGLSAGVVVGILFVWVGHAMVPDGNAEDAPPGAAPKPPAAVPELSAARVSAFRSLLIVLPVLIWFLLSGTSASYAAVMIKVASMGQQASLDRSRDAARSLLVSTVIGGVAAVIAWNILSIAPALTLYILLVALAGLLFGQRIFAGPAMRATGPTWSYGYLTMLVILAPAVLDNQAGSSADAAFYSRLLMFTMASLYGIVAVFVFDHVLSAQRAGNATTAT